jgi:hypothetical protein
MHTNTDVEKVFYNPNKNLYVSNARVIIGGKTYSTPNLTSVAMYEDQEEWDENIMKVICVILSAVIGFFVYKSTNLVWGAVSFFCACVVTGYIAGHLEGKFAKWYYTVSIGTSAGEKAALESYDEKYVQKIVNAINEAIISQQHKDINVTTMSEVASTSEYSEDLKECPMCAELVKSKAKICRFCNYTFPKPY